MPKKYNTAYLAHKQNAAVRSIDFLLTYEEWLQIWEQSGHLHERGCRKGQYCMARFGDKGPYAVGNVKIILHRDNILEKEYKDSQREAIRKSNLAREYKTFKLTDEQRQKISKALKGSLKSEEHRRNHSESLKGFRHTDETRAKMSRSKQGRKFSDETRAKLSEAAKRREAAKKLVELKN